MSYTDPVSSSDRSFPLPEGELAHAFEAMVRAHYGRLCSFVYRYVGSADGAEDVVQDMLVKVWKQRQQVDFERPLAYLYQAARNEAISYCRRRGVRERAVAEVALQESPMAADSARLLEREDLAAAIAGAVAALPERCRLIFTMQREQGLSYAEIAEALGISVKTVETQMSRAFRALRNRLVDYLVIVVALVSASMRIG